jgi:hypothetical protein
LHDFQVVDLSTHTHFEIERFEPTAFKATLERAKVNVRGPLDDVLPIIQQLAWFTAVFRVATPNSLTVSTAIFRNTPLENRSLSGCEFEIFPKTLNLSALVSGSTSDEMTPTCWHRLFHGTILAFGFPISERDEGVGVQIPFELMTSLANITTAIYQEGGEAILIGHSVALFPSEELRDGIQWHCLGAGDNEPISSLAETFISLKNADFDELSSRRTFLGYYEKALVLLGTKKLLKANAVAGSDLNPANSRIELAREGTFSFGLSIKSIVNGTIAGKWTITKTHRVSLADNREYFDLLDDAQARPVLVYDRMAESAWLVAELSLVLHIALTYLAQPLVQRRRKTGYKPLSGPWPELPYAKSSHDGGMAARIACDLSDNHNLELWSMEDGNPKRFWSVVEGILKDLSAIRKAVDVQRANSGWRPWSVPKPGLRGWDFCELATKAPSVLQKELPRDHETSWWGLQEAEGMLVIFGSQFGKLIEPGSNKTPFGSTGAPARAKLLVASMPCVNELMKVKDGKCYLNSLVWNQPRKRSNTCNLHCDKSSCLCIQELGSFSDTSPNKKLLDKAEAVVFGESKHYHTALTAKWQRPSRPETQAI